MSNEDKIIIQNDYKEKAGRHTKSGRTIYPKNGIIPLLRAY